MKTLFIVFGLAFLAQISHAAALSQMKLVTVETQKYGPSVIYLLGFDLDKTGKPTGMFYYDPTKGEKAELHYSFEQLAHEPQLITRIFKDGKPYDIVKLALKDSIITISYQKDARKNKWSEQSLKLECDSTQRNCVIRDPETDKTTDALYLTSHKVLGLVESGVDSIEIR